MSDLARIADRILSRDGLLLSAVGVPHLYKLRNEFLRLIMARDTSADDVSLYDAAVDEIDLAIDMFEKSAAGSSNAVLLAALDDHGSPEMDHL
jgi:hypothetical protein